MPVEFITREQAVAEVKQLPQAAPMFRKETKTLSNPDYVFEIILEGSGYALLGLLIFFAIKNIIDKRKAKMKAETAKMKDFV